MTHFHRVLQFPDGRFLVEGFDCADRYTNDPLMATNMTIFDCEEHTIERQYAERGAILVEFELTATPTGRTCADFFKKELQPQRDLLKKLKHKSEKN